MKTEKGTAKDALLPRRSQCAAQSRKQEVERLRRMTVEGRVRLALEMGGRFTWIKPRPVGPRS